MVLVVVWLIAANVIALALFWTDKARARRGERRIPERILLMIAYAGGSAGAFAGQQLFRHKTRKQPFATLLGWSWLSYAALAIALRP